MARRRWTEERKAQLLEAFASSEMSAAAFCRQHRLPYQRFLCWRKAAAVRQAEGTNAMSFTEIEVEAGNARPGPAGWRPIVELVLGDGMVLRVYDSRAGRS